MSERPMPFEEMWQAYCEGRLSTNALLERMRREPLFEAWCLRTYDVKRRRSMRAKMREFRDGDETEA